MKIRFQTLHEEFMTYRCFSLANIIVQKLCFDDKEERIFSIN